MFANSAGLKVEPRILPVVRSRAQGISLETSVDAKLARWCELTGLAASPVLERLQLLESGDASAIAGAVLARIDQVPSGSPLSLVACATPDVSTTTTLPDEPGGLEGDLFAA
jgi:exonuclease SbcD